MSELRCACFTWAYDPNTHGPWLEPDHPHAFVHHPLCNGKGEWKAPPDLSLPTPLQAATLEALVDELAARFDRGVVVAGLRTATDQSEDYFMDARNGLTACLGLTTRAGRELLDLLADGGEVREL